MKIPARQKGVIALKTAFGNTIKMIDAADDATLFGIAESKALSAKNLKEARDQVRRVLQHFVRVGL